MTQPQATQSIHRKKRKIEDTATQIQTTSLSSESQSLVNAQPDKTIGNIKPERYSHTHKKRIDYDTAINTAQLISDIAHNLCNT
jgi:hypothetical protein